MKSRFVWPLLLICGLFASHAAVATDIEYEVTITNLTRGNNFTPILVASHRSGVALFELGSRAGAELATLAEGGDTGPLDALLSSNRRVADTNTSEGLLAPGATVSIKIKASHWTRRISLASMLLPTNDAFFALNGVALPRGRRQVTYLAPAYDAGSEANDELCFNIPGPTCQGEGASPGAGGEDFVHIHAGIHGIGDLSPAAYDWRNPVARITIRRVSSYY
ncbi:hypothetical protein FKG94_19410 [Exilibacterium tricleocarpae]|uniref:Spondin domain-containing protein n=1 Tax=Exilibacterium tricleocarpae TaxID=2591008 RepID=A0A545T3L5_9GAMM|nr:spondin domain-containing protein [Exilibacterium tricleocarpae]TQV71813.1 hypothetical protein FKG94_19410 [Exilibacterium tricleocarpae]